MSQKIQSIRGMNDLLPEQTKIWQQVEETLRQIMKRYGYGEIRMPVVEKTELFKRSIGEVTDIVEKEMYTFADRNGDSLTLRPEGTAGCVRSVIESGLLQGQTQRLWYMGPMFRHERPQRGRYRQFQQFGVEIFSAEGPDIDAELIAISARFWKELGLENVVLQLNTLGSAESRTAYRDVLVAYFSAHQDQLDEDSQRRLETNPLRILDSKNPDMAELVQNAPILEDSLTDVDRDHFEQLKARLDLMGIAYEVNPRLVRGLDYYGRTVFEWVTNQLGTQGTICAGGRYDGLVEQIGGKPTPAIGLAVGLERLVELLSEQNVEMQEDNPHLYLILAGEEPEKQGLQIAEQLRDALPKLRIVTNIGGGSFKAQFKRADKSGAQFALVIGEEELQKGEFALKDLRGEQPQQNLALDALVEQLAGVV